MNLDQLKQGLEQAFFKENYRIVFWFDPENDFENELPLLILAGVDIVNMKGASALGMKLKLELEDTTGKYLLYFPHSEPEVERDWLLDIKLYSRSFYADRFSIIFNELGLHQQSLREHLSLRDKFLSSKVRLNALKRFVQPSFNETELDIAMIVAVVKAENCDLPHILFALAEEMVAANSGLEEAPVSLTELEKFGLIPTLVSALQMEVGYPASVGELSGEETFNVGQFLIRLLTTGFCESIGDIPPWAQSLAMASGNARATSRALLSRWCDSSRYYKAFDGVSAWVAVALRINEKLKSIELATIAQVATFEVIEQQIIVEIAHAIPLADQATLSNFSAVITNRLNNYWASRHKDDDTRKKYRVIYKALSAAIDLFLLRHSHDTGFHCSSVQAIYNAYESDLYKFDLAYRHYCEASYRAHVDILKKLDVAVEQCYSNWYIDNLAKNWGDNINAESKLTHWKIDNIENQQHFYKRQIAPFFSKSKNSRVVVIVSDAFRYEAAVELKDRINEKRYSEASLSSQLGVVPSYTALGMASLLPHETIEYRESGDEDIFVNGKSTKGLNARNKILTAHGGMAVTAEDVKNWSRDDGREILKDLQLVYVYHNVVDARGDVAATESETFLAVEQAIEELTELTRKILMHFNTSTVVVTADHGFIFQQSKLNSSDKTVLMEKPANAIKSKKRYVVGFNLPEPKDAWFGSTINTAGTLSDTGFWVPKGANRFHFVGGARFVHGGIMPQEIVVPVLVVKQLRGQKAEQRTKRKVGVISPKPALKMVNNIQRFDLMQTETVSEHVLPVTISAAIYDADVMVSGEETITFDGATDSIKDRVKQIRLSLSGKDFDRKKDYFLILKDKDLNTEVERYRVTIDLAFTDDFF
jgi:uncharacterized protein (TIGR02687 family)